MFLLVFQFAILLMEGNKDDDSWLYGDAGIIVIRINKVAIFRGRFKYRTVTKVLFKLY